MKLRYIGPFGQASGYGRACMDNLAAMAKAGIYFDILSIMPFDEEDIHPRYRHLLDRVCLDQENWLEVTHVLVHAIPFGLKMILDELRVPSRHRRIRKIAYTTWETTKLPYNCAKEIDENFDTTIVPCKWNVETFHKAGAKRTHAVPHAFDPEWWAYRPVPRDPAAPYHFYTILTWCARKGPIELLKAYFTAFTKDDPPVKLTIVTPSWSKDDVESLVRCMGLDWLPEVEFVGKVGMRLPDEELRALHQSADCYVSCARGEGWGLGAFEAMICGNPIIAPNFGGFCDFLHDSNAYLVDTFLTPAITPETTSGNVMRVSGLEIKPVVVNAPTGITADQDWAEPDLHAVAYHMHSLARARVKKDHDWLEDYVDRFSYQTVGQLFRNVLETT